MSDLEDAALNDAPRHLDNFGALLLVTALSIVVQSLVDLGDAGASAGQTLAAIAVTGAAGVTVLLAFRAAGVSRRWTRVADLVVGFGIAALVALLVLDIVADAPVMVRDGPPLTYLAFGIVAPLVVMRRLTQHRTVTLSTIAGTLATYLLIAAAFNYAFRTVDALGSEPFFAQAEPTTAFMYFSLVTITTLGYGDLAPVGAWGRLLAGSEAIIGQVFLVTFVGITVGLFVQSRDSR